MKKTLIALALTALPVAAMADVTLYGQIKGGVAAEQTRFKIGDETVKSQLSGADKSTDAAVRDFGSRIGFKGEEDLGNGLKTIWQVEQSVSLGGRTDTGWSNRETFIGLEGGFGKLRVGHIKNVFDDQDDYDPWEYNSNNAQGLGIFSRHNGRVDGASIKYDTPDLAGFSGSLQYRTKANGTAAGQTVVKDGEWAGRSEAFLGLAYENSGFFAKYGFGMAQNAYVNENGNSKSGQMHRIQGGYDANNLFVDVAYQYTKGWESLGGYLNQSALSNGGFSTGSTLAAVNGQGAFNAAYVDSIRIQTADHMATWNPGATAEEKVAEENRFASLEATKTTAAKAGEVSRVAAIKDFNNDVNSTGIKTSELALTASYTMGAITPRISYAHGFNIKTVDGDKINNSKYDQIVIGADYALSKRTTALVSAGWLKQGLGESEWIDVNGNEFTAKDKVTKKSIGVGLKHVF